ncbi:MAG: hypothetical protein J0I20_25065 [Chloroflexi bacterium]|nr:hypothetical protein [Chloroflexota bacterium]OJW02080.1 MAG: hypothetical protein BGO39_27740 [Chloroflexi bacterium 54-19]
MAEKKITESPFGQWIKREFEARQARPAANDFEKGHLDAMLALYYLIGESAFDVQTQRMAAKLSQGRALKPVQTDGFAWFKAELEQASQKTSLSEYEQGYLQTILGAYFATEPAQPDPELQKLADRFMADPAMAKLAERFDMETRTLQPRYPGLPDN